MAWSGSEDFEAGTAGGPYVGTLFDDVFTAQVVASPARGALSGAAAATATSGRFHWAGFDWAANVDIPLESISAWFYAQAPLAGAYDGLDFSAWNWLHDIPDLLVGFRDTRYQSLGSAYHAAKGSFAVEFYTERQVVGGTAAVVEVFTGTQIPLNEWCQWKVVLSGERTAEITVARESGEVIFSKIYTDLKREFPNASHATLKVHRATTAAVGWYVDDVLINEPPPPEIVVVDDGVRRRFT